MWRYLNLWLFRFGRKYILSCSSLACMKDMCFLPVRVTIPARLSKRNILNIIHVVGQAGLCSSGILSLAVGNSLIRKDENPNSSIINLIAMLCIIASLPAGKLDCVVFLIYSLIAIGAKIRNPLPIAIWTEMRNLKSEIYNPPPPTKIESIICFVNHIFLYFCSPFKKITIY